MFEVNKKPIFLECLLFGVITFDSTEVSEELYIIYTL